MGARTPTPQPNPTDTVCPEPWGRSDPSERAALSLEEHRPLDGTATPFDQSPADNIPALPGLQGVSQLAALEPASHDFLLLETRLVRERNKLCHALDEASSVIDETLSHIVHR